MEERDGSGDFDFETGVWQVHNERLVERLVGCTDWVTFPAVCHARPLPGRIGNWDDFVTDFWPGFVGMSLRLYDRATRKWSIYWTSNQTGVLEPPVVGGFTDGVGVFEGRDHHKGTPVLVRYQWSDITRDRARWQQAFSTDEGKTWEVNWIMRFTRVE